MKLIEQPWEKVNLGLKSVEFRFENEDRPDEIDSNVLDNSVYDYQICRVPAGRMDLMYLLQMHGFAFAECRFELSASLKELNLPKAYLRVAEGMDYHAADALELEDIFRSIHSGVFDSDKIALDPYFRREQSGIRFANYARQEIEKGMAFPHIVTVAGRPIGFFIVQRLNEKTSYSLLAALYEKENNIGLGFATIYYPMLQSKEQGMKKIVTGVSSNNVNSLKIHLSLGYEIKSMNYALIKHIR